MGHQRDNCHIKMNLIGLGGKAVVSEKSRGNLQILGIWWETCSS